MGMTTEANMIEDHQAKTGNGDDNEGLNFSDTGERSKLFINSPDRHEIDLLKKPKGLPKVKLG